MQPFKSSSESSNMWPHAMNHGGERAHEEPNTEVLVEMLALATSLCSGEKERRGQIDQSLLEKMIGSATGADVVDAFGLWLCGVRFCSPLLTLFKVFFYLYTEGGSFFGS